MLATPPSGLPGVKPAASAGYIPSLMKRSDQPMGSELGLKARDAPSSAPPPMSSNGDAATPPPSKKQKVLIAPSSSSASTAVYMIGADKQAPQSAQQIAKFQDFLTHVESQYSTFKEQLYAGTLDAVTVRAAFDQVSAMYQTLAPPPQSLQDEVSLSIPNQGTYKEGLRDNPNTTQEMQADSETLDPTKLEQNSLDVKGISEGIATLQKGQSVLNAGMDILSSGESFLANGSLTTMINTELTNAGASALTPLVTDLGLEAGITAAGAEIGLSAAAIGTLAGGAVVIAGIALLGVAAYGLYKAFGGTEEFSFVKN